MDEKDKTHVEKIEEFEKRVTHEKPEPEGSAPTTRPEPPSEIPPQDSQNADSNNNSAGGSD